MQPATCNKRTGKARRQTVRAFGPRIVRCGAVLALVTTLTPQMKVDAEDEDYTAQGKAVKRGLADGSDVRSVRLTFFSFDSPPLDQKTFSYLSDSCASAQITFRQVFAVFKAGFSFWI